MRLDLYGGFGEKGRTCLGVESAGLSAAARRGREDQRARQRRLLSGDRPERAARHRRDRADACARGPCRARSAGASRAVFAGRIFMTAETLARSRCMPRELRDAEQRALVRARRRRATAGRRGRADARAAAHLDRPLGPHGRRRVVHARRRPRALRLLRRRRPGEPVFAMDPIPRVRRDRHRCLVRRRQRHGARARARDRARGSPRTRRACVLPTPLYGRSAELLALVEGPLALAPGMRDALRTQIDGRRVAGAGAGGAASPRDSPRASTGTTATPLPARRAPLPRRHGHERSVARDSR